MTIQDHPLTVEAFDAFADLPENEDRLLEFIGGEIFDVPSNPYASKIAARIIVLIGIYLMKNDVGHLTGEAGGYMVSGERYAPDVAFISYEKQAELAKSGYNPNPPDLAVEVISSDNKAENAKLTIKLSNYLAAGTVVWIVRPEEKLIEVHQPSKPAFVVQGDDGELDGTPVFDGLKIKLSDIFPAIKPTDS